MKITCAPSARCGRADSDIRFILYGLSHDSRVGEAGNGIIQVLEKMGMKPELRAWDFLSIALGIVAADESTPRSQSPDGWTRKIDLEIAIAEPEFWNTQTELLNSTLGFLTGDHWRLGFIDGGRGLPVPRECKQQLCDSVCLLSGGMDSLVGAFDLASTGQSLMLVSQVSKGDKVTQATFAGRIIGRPEHLQLNHNVRPPTQPVRLSERSQRARSVVFLAYGILAASVLDRYHAGNAVELYVPENGFISLNIPLTSLRLGSLSTRTTHPMYMSAMQRLLDAAGLRVHLTNPYQFKTKGEMLMECIDQAALRANAFDATSCGRYARTGFTHCGRCVPCLVRRAAIQRWGEQDQTRYRYERLAINDSHHRRFDDVLAVAMAIDEVRRGGSDRWSGSSLSTIQLGDITPYQAVSERGLEELRVFLNTEGVL